MRTLLLMAALCVGCQSTTTNKKEAEPGVDAAAMVGGDDADAGVGGEDPPPPPPPPPPPMNGEAWVPETGEFALRDTETGTLWNVRGEAFAGPLAEEGARLAQLPAYSSFWFAWSVFNNETTVWTSNGVQDQDVPPIEGSGECGVPCNEIVSGGPPPDGIPSVDHDNVVGQLTMVDADDPGAAYLQDSDFVLGVVLYDDEGTAVPRAYSHNLLWWHEIANDIHGDDIFTVSFCPLTGSGIVFDGGERGMSFGTSGRLYNSNLVMYDRVTNTLWSQMLTRAIRGDLLGEPLTVRPVTETTWANWKRMWPDTTVSADVTGHDRNYSRYPYGDYRTNHGNTFRPTRPDYDRGLLAKQRILGVKSGTSARAYPYDLLADVGDQAVVNDELGGQPLVVVWDADGRFAVPFDARVGDQTLTFEVATAP